MQTSEKELRYQINKKQDVNLGVLFPINRQLKKVI
jgi:hypothetical protein